MGACSSKDTTGTTTAAAVAAEPEAARPLVEKVASVPSAHPKGEDKPKPQIFAIMRNGHEVIRGGMIEVKTAVENGDMETSKKEWERLVKFEGMHKTMEEGNGSDESPRGFFKVLDAEADGIVTNNGLHALHTQVDALEAAVNTAIAESDIAKLQEAYPKFMEFNEAHLKMEEDVMMPSIKKMMMAKKPLKKYVVQDILPTVKSSPDWEYFIRYANEILEKHSNGMPRAFVFDHALWAASSPEEWNVWSKWIEESLSDMTWQKVAAACE